MNSLNREQLDKLADYFMSIAKGLTLASLAAPVVDSATTFLTSVRILLIGVTFAYISLRVTTLKEVLQ